MSKPLWLAGVCVLVFVFAFGVSIGYSLKPQVKVVAYDEAACSPGSPEFWNGTTDIIDDVRETSPDVADSLTRMKEMRPLVKAGPFEILWNSRNGDYLIYDLTAQQELVSQVTEHDGVHLGFNGRSGKASLCLTYDKDGKKVIDSMCYFGEESDGGPTYSYHDRDGDGRFDIMVDRRAGLRYEQKGLQWVRIEDGQVR